MSKNPFSHKQLQRSFGPRNPDNMEYLAQQICNITVSRVRWETKLPVFGAFRFFRLCSEDFPIKEFKIFPTLCNSSLSGVGIPAALEVTCQF